GAGVRSAYGFGPAGAPGGGREATRETYPQSGSQRGAAEQRGRRGFFVGPLQQLEMPEVDRAEQPAALPPEQLVAAPQRLRGNVHDRKVQGFDRRDLGRGR